MTTQKSGSTTFESGEEMAGTTDAPLAEAGKEVGSTATRLAEQATDVALDRADDGRRQAADGVDQLASSIRRVSTDLESDQPSIAGITSTAAEQAERFAAYLQQTDARRLIADVENAARRQPILFLGGAFVLGLATARFLKAGAASPSTDRYRSLNGTGFETPGSRAVGTGGRSASMIEDMP
jgi:hypothetical protein